LRSTSYTRSWVTGETHLKETANVYEIKVFGKLEACELYAMSKAKQKNVRKIWTGSCNVPGERLYFNITLITDESFGDTKFWALIVDDCT
jgi:hypothetical protein